MWKKEQIGQPAVMQDVIDAGFVNVQNRVSLKIVGTFSI